MYKSLWAKQFREAGTVLWQPWFSYMMRHHFVHTECKVLLNILLNLLHPNTFIRCITSPCTYSMAYCWTNIKMNEVIQLYMSAPISNCHFEMPYYYFSKRQMHLSVSSLFYGFYPASFFAWYDISFPLLFQYVNSEVYIYIYIYIYIYMYVYRVNTKTLLDFK
jgi:hypothetical protein